MKETYEDWVLRVMAGRKNRPLSAGESVATSADKPTPFSSIEFVKIDRKSYVAEIGKKGSDYIYHFYPKDIPKDEFEDDMGAAFLEVFKNKDRIEAAYTEELNSWAVKANGFADSLWGDELAMKVLSNLDNLLEGSK